MLHNLLAPPHHSCPRISLEIDAGGQRQRIARALINNPKILIIDEATSTLAVATRIVRMEKGLLVESSHAEMRGQFAFAPAWPAKNTHVSPSNETQEQVV